jgi:hypothetical protein
MEVDMRMITPHEVRALEAAANFGSIKYMQEKLPALFVTHAAPNMSDRYGFTDTYSLVMKLIERKFRVVSAQQTGKGKFGKIMLRLEHPELYHNMHGRSQIVLFDSHDGTSTLKMMLGFFRFVCANGMVVGERIWSTSIKHTRPDIVAQALLDLDDAMEASYTLRDRVDAMRAISLNNESRINFAIEAAHQRFDFTQHYDASTRYTQAGKSLLTRRRQADNDNSVFTVMNVIQENALRGGVKYAHGGSAHTVQAVSSINMQQTFNTWLWNRAMELAA